MDTSPETTPDEPSDTSTSDEPAAPQAAAGPAPAAPVGVLGANRPAGAEEEAPAKPAGPSVLGENRSPGGAAVLGKKRSPETNDNIFGNMMGGILVAMGSLFAGASALLKKKLEAEDNED